MKSLYQKFYYFLVFLLISCTNTQERRINKSFEMPVRIVVNIDRQYVSDENRIAATGMIRSEELRMLIDSHGIGHLTAVYRNRYNSCYRLRRSAIQQSHP